MAWVLVGKHCFCVGCREEVSLPLYIETHLRLCLPVRSEITFLPPTAKLPYTATTPGTLPAGDWKETYQTDLNYSTSWKNLPTLIVSEV